MKDLILPITNLKNFLLDFVLPENKDLRFLEALTAEEIALKSEKAEELEISGTTAPLSYREPMIRSLIWQLKYRGNKKIAKTLAEILYDEIMDEYQDLVSFENFSSPLIIPIPASPKKKKEKGFNQTEILAEALIELDKEKTFEYSPDALTKTKETKNQTSIKRREERLLNLKGSFDVKNPEIVKERNVILIDDVITTGATIKEARRALKAHGARKVLAFAVAH